MILAAGRGERMGALTADLPKPLLKAGKNYLIEYSILSLVKIGILDIVINISYCAGQIKTALGDGSRYGVRFYYSEEPDVLETGGGILNALPLLGDEPFIVLSSDIITDYPLQKLFLRPDMLAHLILVDNPSFHPSGDFCLQDEKLSLAFQNQFSFGNIGIYHPDLFSGYQPGKFRLGGVLKEAISKEKITGEHYQGIWHNIGTPEDLSRCLINSFDSAF